MHDNVDVNGNQFNTKDFIKLLTQNVNRSISNNCRKLIMGLKKQQVKELFLFVNSIILHDHGEFPHNEHL